MLAAADRRLTEVRRGVPDAGGLVIATDHLSARAYAAQLRRITGEAPTVVLSDEAGASARIEAFAAGDDRWMVAVRMVSEGVDVPRLSVGVYATSTSTPLFFAQAVGRFVRARRRGETASVFLPSVPLLLQHAAEMEVERDHALDRRPTDDDESIFAAEDGLLAAGQPGADRGRGRTSWPSRRWRRRRPSTGCCSTAASSAPRPRSAPRRRPTSSACRGCWSRTRSPPCCRPGRAPTRPAAAAGGRRRRRPQAAHRAVPALRKELNGLVGAWHHRTGIPHGAVHTELRQACGGPLAAQASAEQLQARIDLIRAWALRRR